MCGCFMCEQDGYRFLECRKCGIELLREGHPDFEKYWAEAPWWYDD